MFVVRISILLLLSFSALSQETIHVFVALCDNENQGIVPVPQKLGNGQDPANNLYWGAAYGLKTYFKKDVSWKLLKVLEAKDTIILERLLFRNSKSGTYMLADAYNGAFIERCTKEFLLAANQQNPVCFSYENHNLEFGGDANLVAYCGHDGLMEFDVDVDYSKIKRQKRDAIILACYSRDFFYEELRNAQANPILWTTHLMSPEAYTLKSAIDAYMLGENPTRVVERAAAAYHKYQKCGYYNALNLFTQGFDEE